MYRVQLQDFEGPLDLLLFFIRRDELDIYDIPIARIADEFLAYVRILEQIDLDGVGDFIYVAALLINIKVRMLLPRPELDEEGEPIDPRRELVERLLEYMRYKEASEELQSYHDLRGELYTRGHASSVREEFEAEAPEVLVNTSLFDLISALRRVLTEKPEAEPVHAVERHEYTIDQQREYLVDRLRRESRVSFVELARHRHKGFVIATFLATLEMARTGAIRLVVAERATDFVVEREDDLFRSLHENGSTLHEEDDV